jgi:hypothetical protein
MPAKRHVRKHSVYANLNVPELTKAGSGLELYLFADDEKIGEMDVGRGGIFWRGAGRRSGKRISWTRFAQEMDDLVYGQRRTRRT